MVAPRWLVIGAVVGSVSGCSRGPEVVPVEGAITSKGKPLTKVMVKFYADGETRAPLISAVTDGSGRYHLKSETGTEGTVVGTYRVCLADVSELRWPVAKGPQAKGVPWGVKAPTDKFKQGAALNPPTTAKKTGGNQVVIPEEYGHPEATPLRAEVVPGKGSIDFQIP